MDPDSGNTSNMPEPQAAPAPASSLVPPPVSAVDADRIEREWILKTRQILQSTATDPHEQAKQLAALRADYLAKRYNKVIKVGE